MLKNNKNRKSREPSQRQLRVSEQIRHMVVSSLRQGHFRDPDLQNTGDITVTSVDISPDLRNACAYVIPLAGKNSDIIVKALNRAAGFFKKEISKSLELRFTPRISFKLDNSFDKAQHVNNILIKERTRLKPTENDDE